MTQQHQPLLIVLSAPSGAGKTTLCNGLLAADSGISRAITCTTRPPRPGERADVDYHFLSETEFERRVQADEFLEHAVVHGHRYGTLKQEVLERLRSGLDVILNIDVQGAATVRSRAASDSTLAAALVTVFLTVPSVAVLETRLRSRAQDSEEVIQRRLSAARQEAARWREFDYLIVSGSKEEDLLRLKAIVTAERMRRHRVTAPQL